MLLLWCGCKLPGFEIGGNMFCTQCGTAVQHEAVFCTACGAKVSGDVRQSTSSNSPSSQSTENASRVTADKNSLSTFALVMGIASVFVFEFVIVPIVAVVVSSLALAKSAELSRKGASKTGKGQSVAGLVLGVVYSLLGFYYLLLW